MLPFGLNQYIGISFCIFTGLHSAYVYETHASKAYYFLLHQLATSAHLKKKDHALDKNEATPYQLPIPTTKPKAHKRRLGNRNLIPAINCFPRLVKGAPDFNSCIGHYSTLAFITCLPPFLLLSLLSFLV